MRRQTSKVCGTPLPHYLAWAKSWRGSIASNASNTPLQPRNIETPTPDRHDDLKDEDHEEGDASGLCTRDALEEILKSYVASESAFSYHEAFPHAPNPELHISGLGDIELPLGQADFDAIKSKCRKFQAQQGVDPHESASTSQDRVGCVWALDASEVKLHSPLWPEFMSKVVEETCQTLMGSILRAGSRPQTSCNLRELLLYETGSR
ncbi:hypothetical protein BC629DRAFT_1505538 [Irpex lacteus]|nr:hypothetical protein BC629DRAFT_1505538 [Irpex lacteus]